MLTSTGAHRHTTSRTASSCRLFSRTASNRTPTAPELVWTSLVGQFIAGNRNCCLAHRLCHNGQETSKFAQNTIEAKVTAPPRNASTIEDSENGTYQFKMMSDTLLWMTTRFWACGTLHFPFSIWYANDKSLQAVRRCCSLTGIPTTAKQV